MSKCPCLTFLLPLHPKPIQNKIMRHQLFGKKHYLTLLSTLFMCCAGLSVSAQSFPYQDPNLSANEFAKVPLLDGECFSIEPGLYKEGQFGVRLENSCYYKDGKIHSFVKMPYEKKLIDYAMLSDTEKQWLNEFEVI